VPNDVGSPLKRGVTFLGNKKIPKSGEAVRGGEGLVVNSGVQALLNKQQTSLMEREEKHPRKKEHRNRKRGGMSISKTTTKHSDEGFGTDLGANKESYRRKKKYQLFEKKNSAWPKG